MPRSPRSISPPVAGSGVRFVWVLVPRSEGAISDLHSQIGALTWENTFHENLTPLTCGNASHVDRKVAIR